MSRLRRHLRESSDVSQPTRLIRASYWYCDSLMVSWEPKDWDSAAAAWKSLSSRPP